ncbi:MAG: flagellar biosynthesis protein FlhF [Termitinemataceae bacterium]|nr:MAG: flagellar biosynthesis protein FlhF [Termitinemataceae bacterium]
MQESFTIRRNTLEECKERAKELYGPRAQIIDYKSIQIGFIFKHEVIEAKGLVPPPMPDMSKYALGIYKTNPQNVERVLNDTETEKAKLLVAATAVTGKDPQMQELLVTMKNMQEKLEEIVPHNSSASSGGEHENITRLRDLLEQNDFVPSFRKKIIERLRKEIPIDTLDDFYELQQKTLEWIGERVLLYNHSTPKKLPRVIVIVGPTGVGKTTTLVKLAARFRFGAEGKKFSVGLITIDYYRIGAKDQLKEFSKIMEIPFCYADSEEELKKNIAMMSNDVDIILIDTAGKSPHNAKQLAETKTLLDVCGDSAETHLAVSASTKAADIIDIMRQFEPFEYSAVIVTKLDETKQIGNVISTLAENEKLISFLTNGQESTTETIMHASVMPLFLKIAGFEMDKGRLEKCFGQ